MNGGDLVGVNKRAPGSGNHCTRGRSFPVLSRTSCCGSRNCMRDCESVVGVINSSVFRFSGVSRSVSTSSARQNALNECLKPFELRQSTVQNVVLSSEAISLVCVCI